MKNIFPTLFFFFVSTAILRAGSGETGFAFLKIGVGGRAAGMGETAAATTDATAVFWNPAGLALSPEHSVIFAYNRWIDGIQHNFAAVKFVKGHNAFAIHYISTGVDGIEQREIPSETPTAYFSSHDLAVGFSYARTISSGWFAGITGKYIYERIQSSVSAAAFDVGVVHYVRGLSDDPDQADRLRLGVVLSNVGFSGKLIEERVNLPSALRLGAEYDIFMNRPSENSWLVAADVEKPFENNIRLHMGTEYGYRSVGFLRMGYQWGYEARGFTAGIGMKFKRLNCDYGYMPFSHALGSTHRFSVAFQFE